MAALFYLATITHLLIYINDTNFYYTLNLQSGCHGEDDVPQILTNGTISFFL